MKAEKEKTNVSVVGRTDDLRIGAVRALIPPQLLLEELPIDAAALATVSNGRAAICRPIGQPLGSKPQFTLTAGRPR